VARKPAASATPTPSPATAGYSGTPLPAKLGLKAAQRVLAIDAPANLALLLAGAPADLVWLARLAAFDMGLLFTTRDAVLARELARLEPKLADAGAIWIAWPKKTSGVTTDLTENVVRATGLATGLVDVKVCAIDATWSGLKFVRRLKDRQR
jgi:hypothetical protein